MKNKNIYLLTVILFFILYTRVYSYAFIQPFDYFFLPELCFGNKLGEILHLIIGWFAEKMLVLVFCSELVFRFINRNAIYYIARGEKSTYLYLHIMKQIIPIIVSVTLFKNIYCVLINNVVIVYAIIRYTIVYALLNSLYVQSLILDSLFFQVKTAMAFFIVLFLGFVLALQQVAYHNDLCISSFINCPLVFVLAMINGIVCLLNIIVLNKKEY